jgi:hypothetical protein
MTPEQAARDMLRRLEHPRADELTAGDVVELANLIAGRRETMTLRDHFAMRALNGMLAADSDRTTMYKDRWANMAYGFADAMLRARKG